MADIELSMPDTLYYQVAEHEVVLSFNDDAGALAFRYWWAEEGKKGLVEYCLRSDDPDVQAAIDEGE